MAEAWSAPSECGRQAYSLCVSYAECVRAAAAAGMCGAQHSV
jgi:hypothetical protein